MIWLVELFVQGCDVVVMEECNCIVCDIYDMLVQGFIGVIVQLEVVEDVSWCGFGQEVEQYIVIVCSLVCESFSEVCCLVQVLCLQLLEYGGVIGVLCVLFGKLIEGMVLYIELKVVGVFWVLFVDCEEVLFCIVQEVLINVLCYVQVLWFVVMVIFVCSEVWLEFVDDGCGFDLVVWCDGFGLLGMCEWVDVMGGVMKFKSVNGYGMKLFICLLMVLFQLGKLW